MGPGARAGMHGCLGLPAVVPCQASSARHPIRSAPFRCASPHLCSCSKAAVGGSEPADAIRAVNALLTRLDQLRASPNVMVLTTRWTVLHGLHPFSLT